MTELEQRLEAAVGAYPFPPTPSLRESVVRDLPGRPGRPWPKVGLAVGLAALAVALTAVFSPSARSAFRDWFDFIPGVHVERVEKLPPSARISAFDLGRRVSLDEARREARFALRLPKGVGKPSRVFVDRDGAGGVAVTAVYGSSLVLTEWRSNHIFFYKLLGPGTSTEIADVHGVDALWLTGGDHAVFYRGADDVEYQRDGRLAGNVLLWQQGRTGYRLEARIPLSRALALARSLEP